MNIAIFCSANSGIDHHFFQLTEELGTWLAENGHTVVFGGCDMGLMECVARAAHDAGGRTMGMIPAKVEERGHVSKYVDVEFRCDNLSDRKDLMLAHSDVLIALPGGIGTLDEIFTVAASATIGYHAKKVILYNMDGFWQPLIALLDSLQDRGLMRAPYSRHIMVADSLEEIAAIIDGEKA
ncbi:MAG: TIGR00730 family Rossman fold protein [Prevotella sp.]|nr:TIGR00730 family Rossman fold protein [Prevotella sp.]